MMKKIVYFVCLSFVFGFVAVYSGHCENTIVNGQEVDESGLPVINSSAIEPLDAQNSLNVPLGDGGNPSPSGEANICEMIG